MTYLRDLFFFSTHEPLSQFCFDLWIGCGCRIMFEFSQNAFLKFCIPTIVDLAFLQRLCCEDEIVAGDRNAPCSDKD